MKTKYLATVLILLALSKAGAQSLPGDLEKLANDFWQWRARYAPFSDDDVNRLERPGGQRDWSAAAVAQRQTELANFEKRWQAISPKEWPVAQQVDYRLMGSALARVHWELEINPRWQRNPIFYLQQTLTPVSEALTVPAPFDQARSEEILSRIENIPSILRQGLENLTNPPAPWTRVAIRALDGIRPKLMAMAKDLQPVTTLSEQTLTTAVTKAADALETYRAQLQERLPNLSEQTAVGREAYLYFLKNVALYSYSPEDILAMGRQEWNRAVAFEAYERERNRDLPALKPVESMDDWVKTASTREAEIRKFLGDHGLLTVPGWLQHYTLQPMPAYLRELAFTEADDFTSASRLGENCVRYLPPPSDKLGYFLQATALDPRPLTVHEGIPGHYFQLCLSWKHEDPIRRHYYDSGANEGIGFYAEEMMLQAGLFDDCPHAREIIYNFMRLRALRVEVDMKLSLGEFTLEQAAKYLEEKVPMDPATARQEAISFSSGPGQALTYQIGKLQITKFLADARMKQGDKFNLRDFHDFVWKNGNVPIALQEMEYLASSQK